MIDVHLVPNLRDETGTKMFYKPIIFPNDFWQLRSQLFEINQTTPRVPLRIEFQAMSYFKFQLFASLGAGFNESAKQQGGASVSELDEVKRMLVETNPYFLMLTAVVTVLHSVYVLRSRPYHHALMVLSIPGSRCLPSSRMYRTGERRMNWLGCLYGTLR